MPYSKTHLKHLQDDFTIQTFLQDDPNQRAALLDLYNSTQGSDWKISTNWTNPNISYCNWAGISCLTGTTNVGSIKLIANSLVGTLPSSLGQLHSLISLQISENPFLTGSFPHGILNLTTLLCLDLSYNNLTGTLPENIDQLSKLRTLMIGSCGMSGSVPASIGNMTSLVVLRIFNMISISGAL